MALVTYAQCVSVMQISVMCHLVAFSMFAFSFCFLVVSLQSVPYLHSNFIENISL